MVTTRGAGAGAGHVSCGRDARWGCQGGLLVPQQPGQPPGVEDVLRPGHRHVGEHQFLIRRGPVVVIAPVEVSADDHPRAQPTSWTETHHASTVSVNNVDAIDVTTPFGGFCQSGFGRDLSLHALANYTALKTTWVNYR